MNEAQQEVLGEAIANNFDEAKELLEKADGKSNLGHDSEASAIILDELKPHLDYLLRLMESDEQPEMGEDETDS